MASGNVAFMENLSFHSFFINIQLHSHASSHLRANEKESLKVPEVTSFDIPQHFHGD
jgi:hypothetical protein